MQQNRSIAFLFIGGPHHIFHAAPVAAELARSAPDAQVTMLCADDAQEKIIRDVLSLYEAADSIRILQLDLPAWARAALKLAPHSATKLPLLFRHRRLLNSFDAIVVPERTSARIRSMGVKRPKLIHFRHGAGDRAPSSERRLGVFDLVVVPGAKDARRAIDKGYLPADRVAVAGYVKFGLIRKMQGRRPSLFANARPTILYNPHFDTDLCSWERDGRAIIEAFRGQDDYNLIVAPHVRLFEDASDDVRASWEALAEPDKILVDLGSDRSIDMTYTLASDLYLGDVSSQLYEFLVRPRPCLFIDSHGVDWRDDAKYAGWHLGEVVGGAAEVLPAVRRAFGHPQQKAEAQRVALADAVGEDYDGAAARGAVAVLACLDRKAA